MSQQLHQLPVSLAAELSSPTLLSRIQQILQPLSGNRRFLTAATVGGGLFLLALLWPRLLADWRRRRRLRAALDAKRAERRRAKSEFGAYLASQTMSDAEEAEIAALTARQLVARLRDGSLRQDRVLLAYQRRAYRIDQRLNCVVEFLHPDLSEVNLAGPLAGLPVSIKENFGVRDRDTCVGCSVFVGQPADEDCLPVRQIKALGGVPFVRTAVPQTMLSVGCRFCHQGFCRVLSSNPIDGTVLNPANPSRCPGGSSSGEGALIAAGGSPLGLGTDIGGSVRTPAAWCGATSLKTTGGRMSRQGMRGTGLQRLVEPAWGPMAPDVDSLALLLEALLEPPSPFPAELTDPTVAPLPLTLETTAGDKKMTIGYMVSNGQLRAAPCMERAVLLARDRLAARGHRLVPWSLLPSLSAETFNLVEIYIRCVWSDAGRYMANQLRHDDVSSPSVANFVNVLLVPIPLRRGLGRLLRLLGDSDAALAVNCLAGVDSVSDLWTLSQRLVDGRAELLADWQRRGFDAVLCPGNGTPAPPLDDASVLKACLAYNVLFNLFNLPAGVLPVTRVTQADLDALKSPPTAGQLGWEASLLALQDGSLGLPVAVQCAAPPWREDACLRLMREVEAAVAADWQSGQGSPKSA